MEMISASGFEGSEMSISKIWRGTSWITFFVRGIGKLMRIYRQLHISIEDQTAAEQEGEKRLTNTPHSLEMIRNQRQARHSPRTTAIERSDINL